MIVIHRTADIFAEWEHFMANTSNQLKIKFRLAHAPPDKEIEEWARLTRQLIDQGSSREAAGQAVAKRFFPDYNTRKYASSEADTIEYLLQQVGQKK
jgi:hypothetical protein